MININWRPTSTELKRFGRVFPMGLTLAGILLAWRVKVTASPGLHWGWLGPLIFWGVAALVLSTALVRPRAVVVFYLAWMGVVFGVGTVLSYLMLAIIFYLIVTPTGLIFRLVGRDPLNRKIEEDEASYWVARPAVDSIKRYFRQF